MSNATTENTWLMCWVCGLIVRDFGTMFVHLSRNAHLPIPPSAPEVE